jgi:crossover junction endodeoxyribonuclease RuvC
MTILGLDPGLAVTGFGVLRNGRMIDYGQITTRPETPVPERIERVVSAVDKVIRRHQPGACAVETLFFKAVGARSVILAAQVRGGLFYLLARRKIPAHELTPATIKLSLTGNGRAAKSQMQYMVRALLGIRMKLPDHAADALAAAYCLQKKRVHGVLGSRGHENPRTREP